MGTVYVNNITFNDTGTYRCTFHRTLFLPLSPELVTVEKEVELSVVGVGKEDGFKSFSYTKYVCSKQCYKRSSSLCMLGG